jgi:hypothetical protein
MNCDHLDVIPPCDVVRGMTEWSMDGAVHFTFHQCPNHIECLDSRTTIYQQAADRCSAVSLVSAASNEARRRSVYPTSCDVIIRSPRATYTTLFITVRWRRMVMLVDHRKRYIYLYMYCRCGHASSKVWILTGLESDRSPEYVHRRCVVSSRSMCWWSLANRIGKYSSLDSLDTSAQLVQTSSRRITKDIHSNELAINSLQRTAICRTFDTETSNVVFQRLQFITYSSASRV